MEKYKDKTCLCCGNVFTYGECKKEMGEQYTYSQYSGRWWCPNCSKISYGERVKMADVRKLNNMDDSKYLKNAVLWERRSGNDRAYKIGHSIFWSEEQIRDMHAGQLLEISVLKSKLKRIDFAQRYLEGVAEKLEKLIHLGSVEERIQKNEKKETKQLLSSGKKYVSFILSPSTKKKIYFEIFNLLEKVVIDGKEHTYQDARQVLRRFEIYSRLKKETLIDIFFAYRKYAERVKKYKFVKCSSGKHTTFRFDTKNNIITSSVADAPRGDPISKTNLPLIDSGKKDRKTVINWNLFKTGKGK